MSDQWLVQGDLFYRLEGVDSGDEQLGDFVVVDLPRILDGPSRSRTDGVGVPVPLQVSIRKYRRTNVQGQATCSLLDELEYVAQF